MISNKKIIIIACAAVAAVLVIVVMTLRKSGTSVPIGSIVSPEKGEIQLSVSATGTVGLSAGITSPALPALLKGVLCIDMLMGRLEIIAWLVLIYPGTWFGRRMEVK